jgi:hypothetical protein
MNLEEDNNLVPKQLRKFLINKLTQSLQKYWIDDDESERLLSSTFIFNLILCNYNIEMNDKKQNNLREYREEILDKGTTIYKAIDIITKSKFNQLNKIENKNSLLFENSDPFNPINFEFNKEYIMKLTSNDINNLYKRHIENNKLNKKVFEQITGHHYNLMNSEKIINKDEKLLINNSNIISNYNHKENNDEIALINYAKAAKIMGEKQWVIDGNNWMKQFSIDYFLNGLAKKLFLKQYRKDIGKKYSRQLFPEEERDIMEKLHSDNLINDISYSGNKRCRSSIRLYDVGSCYNPFQDCKEFQVTALDLYPIQDSSVYRCDFLELEIGTNDSSILYKKIDDNNKCKSFLESHYQLLQLPKSSSDALCMSLVLSYLPTPIKRIEMIKKARQLLVSPAYNNCIERSGILLIIEKESITSTGKYNNKFIKLWKASIIEQGFQFLSYSLIISGSRKSHAFAFKTSNIEINSNLCKYPLYIKQDFDKNGNGLKEIDDMFTNIDIDSVII